MTYILWGSPHSLYTSKLRSYLIKKGLPYQERFPSDPQFSARILPAVRHMVVPVLETPGGDILQDSGDIIDWLEERHAAPALNPSAPVQALISALFDAVGSEYLLPLAMHYRWTYRSDQEEFLQAEFGRAVLAGHSRAERRAMAAGMMDFFSGFLSNLGVFPETVDALETAYADWLDALDEHFQHHPYLLGGRPCRGDFGMMASLYAHLGRDPVPAGLMKRKAPNLFRWTERMNSTLIGDGEFGDYPQDYLADDAIPESLVPVLALVFRDWTPGLEADVNCFNAWALDKEAGSIVSREGERQVHPNIGPVTYAFHGIEMTRASAPHALWMFASVLDQAKALPPASAKQLDELLDRTGGKPAFALSPMRRMARADNVLVLA